MDEVKSSKVLETGANEITAAPMGRFGDYTIEQKLGEGGYSEVYLARDKLDRLVALKILKKQFSFDDKFVVSFRQESINAAALNHDHIILIYNQGLEDGYFYIAMEYAPNGTLQDYMKQKEGKLSSPEVKIFVQQIASALDFAHRNNLVHRDIKPSNILLGYDNRIKLADFGIARAIQSGTSRLTTIVQGTTSYMAPEQANPNAKMDGRTDTYAFAVVVYQMLTGSLPFMADDFSELIHKKRNDKPPRMEDVPTYVEKVVFKALNATPDLRHRSATDFAKELIEAVKRWDQSTAERQDMRDLLGTALLAMEGKEWSVAKEALEGVLRLGENKLAREHLVDVERQIDLQNAWTTVTESFAKADWAGAIGALNIILNHDPNNQNAPLRLKEAEKQIEWQQLYEEGEAAFAAEDYTKAVERFSKIHQEESGYRDVADRLEEFKRTQKKDELNRLLVAALFALAEDGATETKELVNEIKKLGLGEEFGASSFLDRLNGIITKRMNEQNETTQNMRELKNTLTVQEAHIKKQSKDIETLKAQLTKSQETVQILEGELDSLHQELGDRLYDYITDMQEMLGYLEGRLFKSGAANILMRDLREKIRRIALRGQQLEGKNNSAEVI